MDEKKNSVNTVTNTKTETVTPLNNEQKISEINRMYDANITSQKANLEAAYNQNISNAEANKEKLTQMYYDKRNTAASDYERQRRNFNETAAANGINTGARSQAQISMGNAQQRNQTELNKSQAEQTAEADRNIADIKLNYQTQVNQAVAQNDYQKASALLAEYTNIYNNAMTQAQTLAQYGDFSGYASIYGQEQANAMRDNWIAQNFNLAYMIGYITKSQRDNLAAGRPMNAKVDAAGNSTAYNGNLAYAGAAPGNSIGILPKNGSFENGTSAGTSFADYQKSYDQTYGGNNNTGSQNVGNASQNQQNKSSPNSTFVNDIRYINPWTVPFGQPW